MKTWRNIFVMCAAILSLASCSNDNEEVRQEYQPAHRSAIFNGVKLVLTDEDGNDLGGQTEMFSTLTPRHRNIHDDHYCKWEDSTSDIRF